MCHRSVSPMIVAVILSAWILAARPALADDWRKTYTVSGRAAVRVDTNDGAVRVDTWDGNQIDAHVETVGWKIAATEVRVVERQAGGRVELEVRVPNVHWGFDLGRRSLRIELKMPRQADLTIRTGDGGVEVQHVAGNVDVQTGDGHITVTGTTGNTRLRTGDGPIHAMGLEGQLDAQSGDGRIRVEGRFDLLHLKTNDGSINARILAGSKMAANWSVRSGDGSVTLQLPDGFQADLEAHTGDGRITMDFPIVMSGAFGRSELRGKVNGGGPSLTVRTGDGAIRVQHL